jgi:hypothetical protein
MAMPLSIDDISYQDIQCAIVDTHLGPPWKEKLDCLIILVWASNSLHSLDFFDINFQLDEVIPELMNELENP